MLIGNNTNTLTMNRFRLILLSLFAIAACVSCSNDDEEEVNYAKKYNIVLNDRQKVLRDSLNFFAGDFYKALCKNVKADNFVISPLSASIALSMLANGASEEAKAEILEALDMKGISIAELNEYNKLFVENLPKMATKASLSMGNLLWLQNTIKPQTSFVSAMQQSYNSEVLTTDKDKGIVAVNEWISKATNGNIPQVLPENDIIKLKNFALVNTLTFHGQWTYPYDEKDTKDEQFTNADGSKSTVRMMNQRKTFAYYETANIAVVEFPYGDRNKGYYPFVLSVALPEENVPLDECMEEMLKMDISNERKAKSLKVKMPKVNFANYIDLVSTFQSMGIKSIFSEGNLKGIADTEEPLTLRLAQQSAVLKFDEKGTIASAATMYDDVATLNSGITNGEFFIDHPFVFTIKAKDSNVVLFMGKVTKL